MRSFHYRLLTFALAFCLGCAAAPSVFAQTNPFFGPGVKIEKETTKGPGLRQILNLTPAQYQKLDQIGKSHRGNLMKAFSDSRTATAAHNTPAANAAMRRFQIEYDRQQAEIVAVLNPTQRKKWKEMTRQYAKAPANAGKK